MYINKHIVLSSGFCSLAVFVHVTVKTTTSNKSILLANDMVSFYILKIRILDFM